MKEQTQTNGKLLVPPGAEIIQQGIFENPCGKINFKNPTACSTSPLPPLVQTYYDSENGVLQMYCMVYIASETFVNKGFTIYYNPDYTARGRNQPLNTFFIAYDTPDMSSSSFYAYSINFSMRINKPADIQTILWDTDPRGSRGTVTTVQPA